MKRSDLVKRVLAKLSRNPQHMTEAQVLSILNSTPFWVTRDGRVLLMSEMETDHLRNTIAMLRRKGYCTLAEFDEAWMSMSLLRGEYALMAAEESVAMMHPSRVLEQLEAELARRKPKKPTADKFITDDLGTHDDHN